MENPLYAKIFKWISWALLLISVVLAVWAFTQFNGSGEGAAVPISGFGNLMAQGVRDALARDGALGILTGGLTSAAAGITAARAFSLIASVMSKSRDK